MTNSKDFTINENKPKTADKNSSYIPLLPPDLMVCNQAYHILETEGIYSSDFEACITQDPILVLEIIKKNALLGNHTNTSQNLISAAIRNLGATRIKEIFEYLLRYSEFESEEIKQHFELLRNRGKRISITSKILSEAIANNLSENCQLASIFSTLGEMLGLITFGENYLDIVTTAQNKSKELYQLSKLYEFNPETAKISFLQKNKVPLDIIYVHDKNTPAPTLELTIVRPICLAAQELVSAFDNDQWEKYAPTQERLKDSYLEQLKIPQPQYAKIYERLTTYLNISKNIINLSKENLRDSRSQERLETSQGIGSSIELKDSNTLTTNEPPERLSQLNISQNFTFTPKNSQIEIIKNKRLQAPIELYLQTPKGQQFIQEMNNMFDCIDNSEELLSYLLEKLTVNGPFKRSALIVISDNKRYALVVAARGENIKAGQKLLLDDPLSPLAQNFSKILSFGNKPNKSSPFGSKTFALAPINANHTSPVALYADCGNANGIPLETRRIFRTAITILNQYLPTLKGSIPNELNIEPS